MTLLNYTWTWIVAEDADGAQDAIVLEASPSVLKRSFFRAYARSKRVQVRRFKSEYGCHWDGTPLSRFEFARYGL